MGQSIVSVPMHIAMAINSLKVVRAQPTIFVQMLLIIAMIQKNVQILPRMVKPLQVSMTPGKISI